MAWVKIDDGFYQHPKRWLLGERLDALGLWLVCLCYASHQLTDGFIPKEFVDRNRPRPDRRNSVKALVDAGLLHMSDGGYVIHDYLNYNPTRAEVLAKRDARAKAGSKGGKKSKPPGSKTEANASGSAQAESNPDPTPTPNTSSSDKSDKDTVENEKASADVKRLCNLLADEIRQRDPKFRSRPESAGWLKEMRLLVEHDRGGDVAEVERILLWSQRDSFWQSNILSPKKLRDQFTMLRQRAGTNAASRPAGANPTAAQIQAARDRARRQFGEDAA